MNTSFNVAQLRELNAQRTPGPWYGYVERWGFDALERTQPSRDLSTENPGDLYGVWAAEPDEPICIDSTRQDTKLIGMLPEIVEWALENYDELVRLRQQLDALSSDSDNKEP